MDPRHCAFCGDERLFERPPCEDGCDDCPDWACIDCGAAVVIGVSGDARRMDRPTARSGTAADAA